MLHICHGNRLENLGDRLLSDLANPVSSVLAPELIAVQGQGMTRWLSLWMSSRQGIIANIKWLYPAEMLWYLFRAVLTEVPATNAFSAEALSWRALSILADKGFVQAHPPLASYLEYPDPLRAWQLARRLGQLYEQYLVYRPDWIQRWQNHFSADEWQADLWQCLISSGSSRHWLTLQQEMLEQLNDNPSTTDRLPQRISLFALSGLSLGYLNLLQAVSRFIDVTIYHHNFSQRYWAEIVSDKERARLNATASVDVDNYLETGHRLLATMGRQGRDYHAQLLQLEAVESEVFSSPPTGTLLGRMQSDIFELRESKEQPYELKSEDTSVQVHVCHSTMREVEVLHDRLLDLFQGDHTLKPSDVLVLVPDINACAPFVKAVFGAAIDNRHIPWRLVDQGLATTSPLVQAFLTLLDLPSSRFEADVVSSLLDISALHRRFGLTETDVRQVQHWVRDLGICWGVDAVGVANLNLPLGGQHTWRSGTDRLLLGHALGDAGEIFSGILPSGLANGGDSYIVGRLCTLLEQLFELRSDLAGCRRVVDWTETLNQVLDRFFRVTSDEEEDLRRLREHVAAIARVTATGGFKGKIPLVVFLDALKARLATVGIGQFMTGAVTFAALAQGRCLPSQVICLLGMNNEVFPSQGVRDSLDQMIASPRPGDRRRRDEDRHVFLEALLSARERLYISYVGRDVRDDSECPPSVLVSELLDFIDSMCTTDRSVLPSNRLTLVHPLQSFSARYFNAEDEMLFSYAAELVPPVDLPVPESGLLISRLLPPVEIKVINPETLTQFFSNPARMLLRDRLGILLEGSKGRMPTREPVVLDFFTRKDMAEATLKARIAGESREKLAARLRAGGKLPAGTPGDLLLAFWWQQVAILSVHLQELLSQESRPQVIVDVMVNDTRLQASLNNVTDQGLIRHSINAPDAYDLLKVWFLHLALNVAGGVRSRYSRLLTGNRTILFQPVDNAREVLSDLIEIYREGMTRALNFFPRSALAYIETTSESDVAAARVWHGSDYILGEADNAYYALVFREKLDTVLEGEFQTLAKRVFGPLCAHFSEEDTS